jgi:hypothetical protein
VNGETETGEGPNPSRDKMLEQAKQLLVLTDLVDRYPAVVSRRTTGLIFVLVGGAISITGLVFATLIAFLGNFADNLLVVFLFVVFNLLIAGIIAFRLVVPLTKSYSSSRKPNEGMNRALKITWAVLSISIVIVAVYSFGIGQPYLFAIGNQIILACGNIANYSDARKNPDDAPFARSILVLVILVVLSIIPMAIFPILAFSILILVDIGGIYGLGIYMLVSAERLLLEVTRQG